MPPSPPIRKLLLASVLIAAVAGAAGCRSMPAAPRPFEASRTFAVARADCEPHVLTVTLHAPTLPIRFTSPQALTRSLLVASAGYVAHERYRQATGRTMAYHMVGHAMIELKSVGPDGDLRYLLAAVTEDSGGQTADLMLRKQVGFSLTDVGTRGRLESADEVARDIDEAAKTNVRAVRVRFLVSAAAAARVFEFFDGFARRGLQERYSLTAYPLDGTGSGCTSLVASALEAAGLLDPAWQEQWRVRLRVPEELFGDPDRGVRVPPRKLLFGQHTRRWATASEPHRDLVFYDTTAMYEWAAARATRSALAAPDGSDTDGGARQLGMPVATIDLRHVPTPSGPIFR